MLILHLCDGSPTPFDLQYLVEYDPTREGIDPDGKPMTAHLLTSPDKQKAKLFSSFLEAAELWRLSHGTRPDGLPNRPLTAFTVTFEAAEPRAKAAALGLDLD